MIASTAKLVWEMRRQTAPVWLLAVVSVWDYTWETLFVNDRVIQVLTKEFFCLLLYFISCISFVWKPGICDRKLRPQSHTYWLFYSSLVVPGGTVISEFGVLPGDGGQASAPVNARQLSDEKAPLACSKQQRHCLCYRQAPPACVQGR